jgi:hypothetical protein
MLQSFSILNLKCGRLDTMNYARSIGLFLLMLFCVAAAPVIKNGNKTAAAAQGQNCPAITVTGPDEVTAGDTITFTANVSGGDKDVTPTYNWSVSAGTISSGQGASTIIVDTTEIASGGTVTASAELGGYDRSCQTVRSTTTTVLAKKADARKSAEYGKVNPSEEKTILDQYAIELMNDPTAQGYIVAYPGRAGGAKEMQATVMKAIKYLSEKRTINAGRLLNLEGAQRDKLAIELWVVPDGANPPEVAAPTVMKPATEKPKPPARKPAKSKKS